MDNGKATWRQTMRPSSRKLIQLYSALLHNAHLKGFVDGEIYRGAGKYACTPGLNCYSCPGAVGACPLGALQNALASSGHLAGWYVLGILLLFGVTLGRTICGWLCPLGLIQELLHKIPTFKIRKSRLTRALSWLKYLILAVFVAGIPLWYGLGQKIPVPGFCKYICPAGTLEGAVSLLSHPANAGLYGTLGALFTGKLTILLLVALACIFLYRGFCRFLCPLGAIYGLFNRFCLVGVRVDAEHCNGCGACLRSCAMDVRQVGDHECIHCARCMDVCAQKAISLKAGGFVLKAPSDDRGTEEPLIGKKRRRIAWGCALALLCFALVWFNFLDPAVQAEKETGTVEQSAEGVGEKVVGSQPGMRLQDFTVDCLDGTSFRLADARGKVVMINLWATYCGPCVRELPSFDALYREHEEDLEVLAVHASVVTEDPAAFLADKDYAILFAVDGEDDRLWTLFNGSSTLPQTIVLNRAGEVIYNQKGSVTPELLAALYEQAAAGQTDGSR